MRRVVLISVATSLLLMLASGAASAFGVKDVVAMTKDGVADSLILQKIDYSGTRFHLDARDVHDLKAAGVSDAVISAMLQTEGRDDEYPVPVYGYGAPSAPVYITPSSTAYGGVTFEISPSDAEVFVDGQYVGQVRDFDGVGAPLNVMAGRHRVDVNAPGYEPLSFDVDVTPGRLVPYRGDMQPVQ